MQGAAPAPPKAPKQPGPAVPKLGTFEAQKSKYYSHMVVDPVSGAHYDADTGKTTDAGKLSAADIVAQEQATVTARQIAKFAGALVVIVLITARLAAIIPQYYHWWLGVGAFVGCLLMPILGAAPYGEDDSSDVPLGIALYLVLGPVVGAISYAVISALRSAFNPAILGVGFVYVVIRVAMDAFAPDHGIAQLFTSLMPWTMPPGTMSWPSHLVSMYLVFAGLAGWYAAGMFHKLNE